MFVFKANNEKKLLKMTSVILKIYKKKNELQKKLKPIFFKKQK